jgi:hypothetical protein
MKTIDKKHYMELLDSQRQRFANKAKNAKDDLLVLELAIKDLESKDFDKVEVIEKDGTFTFNIVEKNND